MRDISKPGPVGPDPKRIANRDDLGRELRLLFARASIRAGDLSISRQKVARRLGVPRSTFYNYMRGKSLIPMPILDRIVIELGATPDEQCEWSEAWQRIDEQEESKRRATNRSELTPTDSTTETEIMPPPPVSRQSGPADENRSTDPAHSGSSDIARYGRLPPELASAAAETLVRLAHAVQNQWETEERNHRVHNPFPMPTRLVNAAEHLADHWQNIRRTPADDTPIRVDDPTAEIVSIFNRIPSRRLVVLGGAGGGKTVLTSRFVLTLLETGPVGSGEPVPVILSLGSWDPTSASLRTWMAQQLTIDYPALVARDSSNRTLARRMLEAGLILPVLDGFDEISEGLRAKAISRINSSLRPWDAFLLTSRDGEYAAAIAASDVLAGAAVVRIQDLGVADLAAYLPLTTRKDGLSASRSKWQPVIEAMRDAEDDSPAGVLAQVLGKPLMVALARTTFSDTGADPALLLRVKTRRRGRKALLGAVEDFLLDSFIPSAYVPDDVFDDDGSDGEKPRRAPSWQQDAAIPWLVFMANHMSRQGTRDFAWWRLDLSLTRLAVSLTGGVAVATPICVVTAYLVSLGTWPDVRAAWIGGTAFGIMSGIGAGLLLWYGYTIELRPMRMRLHSGRPLKDTLKLLRDPLEKRTAAVAWFAAWIGGGFVTGATAWEASDRIMAFYGSLSASFGIGAGIYLLLGFLRVLGTPVDVLKAATPRGLLAIDRTTSLQQGFIVGSGGSVISWSGMALALGPIFGVSIFEVLRPLVLVGGLVLTGLGGGLIWIAFFTIWGRWLMARLWLPVFGRLPWRVVSFLDDALHRGVLRRSGAVYQFRHGRLQDRIVINYDGRAIGTEGAALATKRSTPKSRERWIIE